MSSKGISKSIFSSYCCRTAMVVAALSVGASSAMAVPADPRPVKHTQPDGTVITVQIRGDEHSHYYLSTDNKVLTRIGDTYYYSTLAADGSLAGTDIKVGTKVSAASKASLADIGNPEVQQALRSRADSSPRKAPQRGPGLFSGTPFPAKGQQKVLVILVEYQNKAFTLDDPHDYFNRMLNQRGFSDYDGTGSAYDYFVDNSNGQFKPEFDVYGPVKLSKNYSYYGGNDWWGNDQNPHEMIIEACSLLDSQIDFTQYDRNNDGYIDNVYVFYAGRGEATGGSADTVWPHSWNIMEGTGQTHKYDGKILDRYACSNEWEYGVPDGIGTFVHEFSHVLGLPDLYATDYGGAFTPGAYSVLDEGPYNNDGRTPPAYGVFERYALDWLSPTVIDGPNTIKLQPVSNNKGCIIPTDKDNEYFLLENRQQEGWDAYIPGHGMLIWHVDVNQSVWDSNSVNNTSSHQYVDIEEADNDRSSYTRDGDTFPGTSGKTSFTDDTKPSMKTWGGKKLNLPITDIEENGKIVSFNVAGGLPDVFPVTLSDPANPTATTFDIEWTADENATSYLVSVYTKTPDSDKDNRTFAPGWNLRDVGNTTRITIDGLQPLTLYHCVVYSSNGAFTSDASNEVSVSTAEPTLDMLSPVAIEATGISGESFTANWEELAGANEYLLNVFTLTMGGYDTDICDFTGGIKALPAGWTTNSTLTYANSAYSGAATPSLRLSGPDTYVCSPKYESDVVGLSFWHRGSKAPQGNTVRVYAVSEAGAVTLVAEMPIVNEAPGAVIDIPDFPEGTRAVKIEYHMDTQSGSLAIDDVCVRWNRQLAFTPIEGYSMLSVGGALQYDVQGLQPETEYRYTVVATDGQIFSKPSNEIVVTTTRTTAAASLASDASIRVSGRCITVSAPAGTRVAVLDVCGRTVASTVAGADGRASLSLPASGLYIVHTPLKASKITIR